MAELIAGKMISVAPGVRRLLAPNPGPFTGPGTNTYILGTDRVAVIDPGPASPKHVQALLEEVGSQIEWILTTHTHADHSPAVKLMLEALDRPIEVIGIPAPQGSNQDLDYSPTLIPSHGYHLETDEFTLEGIFTPGHASNHMCYLLREQKMLFTGDHLMQGSSVIIAPPDGNMGDYMASLELLFQYDIDYFAPAHGHLMEECKKVIEHTRAHRLKREKKVFDLLNIDEGISLADLTAPVYDDVPVFLHPAGQMSLKAHLISLVEQGVGVQKGELWYRVEGVSL
ncbi:MAG: MBL fold metallo-hydrolase [Gammaproteobacteria bacterium]|nr:MAG: MBL fold metallo-hydrolase [Gammaproteobacteria bacterium]